MGSEAPVKRSIININIVKRVVYQRRTYPTIQAWRPWTYRATMSSISGPQDGSSVLLAENVSMVCAQSSPTWSIAPWRVWPWYVMSMGIMLCVSPRACSLLYEKISYTMNDWGKSHYEFKDKTYIWPSHEIVCPLIECLNDWVFDNEIREINIESVSELWRY